MSQMAVSSLRAILVCVCVASVACGQDAGTTRTRRGPAAPIWELQVPAEEKDPRKAGDFVLSGQIGKFLLAGRDTFHLIDCEHARVVGSYGFASTPIWSLGLSPDARRAIVGEYVSDVTWRIIEWDLEGGRRGPEYGRVTGKMRAEFVPDAGKAVCLSLVEDDLRVWDRATQRMERRIRPDHAFLSRCGRWGLAVLWEPDTVQVVDLARGQVTGAVPRSDKVDYGDISADGKRVALGCGETHPSLGTTQRGGKVWVVDAASGKELCSFAAREPGAMPSIGPAARISRGPFYDVDQVAISPNGRLIAARTDVGIIVWDIDRKSIAARWPEKQATDLVFCNGGRDLATLGPSGLLRMWRIY